MDTSSLFQILKLARRFSAYLLAFLSALRDGRLFLQLSKQTSPCPFQRAPRLFLPTLQLLAHTSLPLGQQLPNSFCTESNSKYFRPCGTHGLCCHHSALPPWLETGCRQSTYEWAWLAFIKALSMTLAFGFSHSFHVARNIILTLRRAI